MRHLVYLCHQKWRSYNTIQFIRHVPILFLTSMKDELVPPFHMSKLYKAAETRGAKVWRSFENGTHNDACMQVRLDDTCTKSNDALTTNVISPGILKLLPGLFEIMSGISERERIYLYMCVLSVVRENVPCFFSFHIKCHLPTAKSLNQ